MTAGRFARTVWRELTFRAGHVHGSNRAVYLLGQTTAATKKSFQLVHTSILVLVDPPGSDNIFDKAAQENMA